MSLRSRLLLLVVLAAGIGGAVVAWTATSSAQSVQTFRGRTAQGWYRRAVVRRDERDVLQRRLGVRAREVVLLAQARDWNRRKRLLLRRRLDAAETRVGAATRALQAIHDPVAAIRLVFGPYSDQAIDVASCESHLSVWAKNGQYENIFQMGESERRTYGWHTVGSPAIVAALSAYAYFVESGRDWSPWECKP